MQGGRKYKVEPLWWKGRGGIRMREGEEYGVRWEEVEMEVQLGISGRRCDGRGEGEERSVL